MSNEQWIVEGFSFRTKQEYEKAAKEQESVAYIKANSDLKNVKSALKIYMNLTERDIFETVVGYNFMESLRRYILSKKIVPENMVPPIAIKPSIGSNVKKEGKEQSKAALEKKCEKLEHKHSISMYLNVFLVMIVIAMFAISYYSPKNNEKIAREKIQNEYAQWEQQLQEREKALEENTKAK